MAVTTVDLGFMEQDYDPWEVASRHFPSKIGGLPAWLDLANLPKPEELQCRGCQAPMVFLLQVYSPEASEESAFHRSLLLFLCTSSSCWGEAEPPLLVLRSQLGLSNPYYPTEAPVEEEGWREDIRAEAHGRLCPVCGCRATKTCTQCQAVTYCSEVHQRLHWKAGHKKNCKEGGNLQMQTSFLLKEGLVEREPEPGEEKGYSGVQEDLEKYRDLIEGGVEANPGELEAVEDSQEEDTACNKFRHRVSRAKDQVLRYERGGKPLLCAAKPPLASPSHCGLCGQARQFEMQVMPQLLMELGLGLDTAEGGLDWGSLYIFTCSKSCSIQGYVREEIQLRNFDRTNLPGT